MRILLILFSASLLAQSPAGTRVLPPTSLHQYSYSPLSVKNDKLHVFDGSGHAKIVNPSNGVQINPTGCAPGYSYACAAPYPEVHWDNYDDDLLYTVGRNVASPSQLIAGTVVNDNKIESWRPSTGKYTTVVDYTGRFTQVQTGASSDLTYDGWIAFVSQPEDTVCAVNLSVTPAKSYCLNYNTPNAANLVGNTYPGDVDWVVVTPKDSVSGLHYVVMLAVPAAAVFSVDIENNTLDWVVRPEEGAPYQATIPGENDQSGICKPLMGCMTTPHGNVMVGLDGQVYFVFQTAVQGGSGDTYVCAEGEAIARLNDGTQAFRPANLAGFSGGGMIWAQDYTCGGNQVWSDAHIGCSRWASQCVVSFDTPDPQSQGPKNEQVWNLGLNALNQIVYTDVGYTDSSAVSYYAESRAALSMDGSEIIYDSDAGTRGVSIAVYELASGMSAVGLPSPSGAKLRGKGGLRGNWTMR